MAASASSATNTSFTIRRVEAASAAVNIETPIRNNIEQANNFQFLANISFNKRRPLNMEYLLSGISTTFINNL
jgi:hypothetical protein